MATEIQWKTSPFCRCYFCLSLKEHKHAPGVEIRFEEMGHRLLVAESLKPEHSLRQQACWLCGHTQEEVK